MNKPKQYHSIARLFFIFSCLFVIALAVAIFNFSSYEYITRLVIDDALYYPIVANNIAMGYGSTFDNITVTNGYHPLWCWLNIPFSLLGKTPLERIFILKSLVVFMVLAMLLAWCILLRKIGLNYMSIAFFILLMGGSNFWSIRTYYSGMETSLVTLMIGCSLFVYYIISKKNTTKLAILLGIFLAGAFLARLDSIFFVFSIFLFWVYQNKKITKQIAVTFFIFLIMVLPYMIWNQINFGSIMPLSGIAKTYYNLNNLTSNLDRIYIFMHSEIFRVHRFLDKYKFLYAGIVILVGAAVYLVARVAKHKWLKKEYDIFFIIYCSTALHFIYNIFFMTEIVIGWHQYLIHLSIFCIFALFIEKIYTILSLRRTVIVFYVATFLLISLMIQYTVSRVPASESIKNEVIIAANFAKNRLPANTVFGMSDAGIFRLISERKTIGFNGLIANRDILQLVLNKQYATIVDRYNVEYYVLPLPAYKLERLAIKPVYLSKKFMYNWLKGGTEEGYVAIFPAKDIFKVIGPNP